MTSVTVGLDTTKSIFHVVEKNISGRILKKVKLPRSKLVAYFANKETCTIAIEACGACHYWSRVFSQLGHSVMIIAPQYVAQHRIGNKNDFNDAQALADVAQREDVRIVPAKSIEQQDAQLLHRVRERYVKQRTALGNQIRGLLAEYGVVIPRGISCLKKALPFALEDSENELSSLVRMMLDEVMNELITWDEKIKNIDKLFVKQARDNEQCQSLQTMTGIGALISSILWVALGDGKNFKNGRHFAAWCGLVPKQHSTGDKARLLGISKRGNAYLRTQLINGARSALKHAKNKDDRLSVWAVNLEARAGFNKACVALANKMARMAWSHGH
ncbi:IS110 family transposase [Shewanella phaeophyticola]|uniref:IS110 family transposase n=1 Tax=Shewanella phaeophyticola TaxID=2978345 RepID=A0ABT2P4T8_9GAMM|nr:IS110 family transposase [Shewanella sp. KJ10-1]MCT8987381.1 IS110 family transposase [Shewanella sp. KJ10-1]